MHSASSYQSIRSIDPQIGLSIFDPEDAELKRALIKSAASIIASADGTKLGTAAPFFVAHLVPLAHRDRQALNVLVPPPIRNAGVKLIEANA